MSLLFRVAIVLVLACAAGCSGTGVTYFGSDVTGASFGREFRLSDPEGRERTLADFRGRYVMLFFGFTQCPDVCPTALARAAEVRKQLGDDGGKVQVIFVTIDPERDTPALLRQYTQAFDSSFLGLRGDAVATRKVAEEFHAFYQKVSTGGSYTMDHSAVTYVFDPMGRLRLLMRHDQPVAQYVTDLRTLMKAVS